MINTPIRRLGRKTVILKELYSYFPHHDTYVEPFLGSGVVFLNKPIKSKANFLNDLDDNIILCYDHLSCLQKQAELIEFIEMVPYSNVMWERIKMTKDFESDTQKVAYFLILSAWGFLGKKSTLKYSDDNNNKDILLKQIKHIYKSLCNNCNNWLNKDFRQFFKSISFRKRVNCEKAFCYNDPPYIGCENNYKTPQWTEQDLRDLVRMNVEKGWQFAISEFDNAVIHDIVSEYGLNFYEIKDRRSINKRDTEILITNYKKHSLFLI